MFTSRENFLGKRGARDTFFHHEDTVDVDTSFHDVKHANVIKPGNRYEEGKRTRCQRVDQSL